MLLGYGAKVGLGNMRVKAENRMVTIVNCVTEKQNLSISRLVTETKDRIVECTVDFAVHSADELEAAIDSISMIRNIDEVYRINIE